MTRSGITAWIHWFGSGWHQLVGLGIVVTIFAWIGLARRRAPFSSYLRMPLFAPLLVLGGLFLMNWARSELVRAAFPWALRAYLPLLVFPVVGFVFGRICLRSRPSADHRRGALILPGPSAAGRLGLRSARMLFGASPRLSVAGIQIPPADELKHFKFIGTTGTGKSSAIRELLSGALARGDRAIIADPDGGYLKRFYDPKRGDQILNPFDPRSAKWDVFKEIRQPYDCDGIARSLIGEGSGNDQTWNLYAQTYLASLIQQTHVLKLGQGELMRLLTAAPIAELRLLLDGTPASAFVAEGNEKMFGSISAVTQVHTKALEYIREAPGQQFSIRDWVGRGKGVLFLPYQADQIAALRSIISTWMRIAIFDTMSRGEGDRRIWFVIDELDALGAIDGLKDALARLRKFGGRCVLGFQSIAQVRGLYGDAEAQTIIENCGNTLILRCSASEGGGTAQFASRLIGERELVRKQVTHTRSGGLFERQSRAVSEQRQHITELALLPAEIEQLPDMVGYLKLASSQVWRSVNLQPRR